MESSTPLWEGTCLCGSVNVKATGPALLTMACHCRDCQKLTASAFSLTTMFSSDSFSYIGDLIKGGNRSSERVHYFCKSCLNFVFSEINGATHRINLRTSILDEASQFEPFIETMTDQKMPWVRIPAVHSFTRYPKSLDELQMLMNEYSKQ